MLFRSKGSGEITWLNTEGVLSYQRGKVTVILNTTETSYPISGEVLLSSQKIEDMLPPKSAVWLIEN